jgi:hypothetical protein
MASLCSATLVMAMTASTHAQTPKVAITSKPAEKKVEVTVDGRPFTAYIWPDTLEKPVLYPISTAAGTVITRGFPPLANERQDHPHHVGLWFNYGDVDGFDFWNNSDAIKPDQKVKMGSVKHREVVKAESRGDHAILQVTADWVSGDGKTRRQPRGRARSRCPTTRKGCSACA